MEPLTTIATVVGIAVAVAGGAYALGRSSSRPAVEMATIRGDLKATQVQVNGLEDSLRDKITGAKAEAKEDHLRHRGRIEALERGREHDGESLKQRFMTVRDTVEALEATVELIRPGTMREITHRTLDKIE